MTARTFSASALVLFAVAFMMFFLAMNSPIEGSGFTVGYTVSVLATIGGVIMAVIGIIKRDKKFGVPVLILGVVDIGLCIALTSIANSWSNQ